MYKLVYIIIVGQILMLHKYIWISSFWSPKRILNITFYIADVIVLSLYLRTDTVWQTQFFLSFTKRKDL